jgi:hypothetical protein
MAKLVNRSIILRNDIFSSSALMVCVMTCQVDIHNKPHSMRLQYVLPLWGYVLPQWGYVLPQWGYVLPRWGYVFLGHSLMMFIYPRSIISLYYLPVFLSTPSTFAKNATVYLR